MCVAAHQPRNGSGMLTRFPFNGRAHRTAFGGIFQRVNPRVGSLVSNCCSHGTFLGFDPLGLTLTRTIDPVRVRRVSFFLFWTALVYHLTVACAEGAAVYTIQYGQLQYRGKAKLHGSVILPGCVLPFLGQRWCTT